MAVSEWSDVLLKIGRIGIRPRNLWVETPIRWLCHGIAEAMPLAPADWWRRGSLRAWFWVELWRGKDILWEARRGGGGGEDLERMLTRNQMDLQVQVRIHEWARVLHP